MQPQLSRLFPRWSGLLIVACLLFSMGAQPATAALSKDKKTAVAQRFEVKKKVRSTKSVKHVVARKRPLVKARKGNLRITIRSKKASVAKARPAIRVATKSEFRTASSAQLQKAPALAASSTPAGAGDRQMASASSTALNDDPVFLRSGSALVVDEGTDRVLLSKNADTTRPIASLTKLMTAAVILDAHLPMDQMIEITDADIDTLKGSSSRLRPGTRLTREELLKLALMSSENRAAHALARTYPGGLQAFITAMNRKAQELGMESTRYVEPTGLSPQNESTAHDLALLVKAAYHYPVIREFSTHPESEVDVGRRTLQYRNTDHLVFNRSWDILLQKTGYINEAGHCLVLQTLFEGRRVIVVLLDAWGKYSHFGDAERIRSWLEARGFDALHDPAPVRVREEAKRTSNVRLMRTALVEGATAAGEGD